MLLVQAAQVAGVSISAGSLPNLAVVTIFPSYGPKWLRFIPILPRVGEPFFVNVVVINSEDVAASNFELKVRILWGLNESVSNVGDRFDRLARESYLLSYGPYTVQSSSNVTVTATVNSNHTVLESDYGDNSLTSAFAVGDLFPTTKILPKDRVLWEQSEVPTFRDRYEFDNRLHVAMSKDGDVVAVSSDSGHVSLYKNGSQIYDAQLNSLDRPSHIALSPSGRYFALGTFDYLRVFDVEKLQHGNYDAAVVFRAGEKELRSPRVSDIAVADNGIVAVNGGVTCCGGFNRMSLLIEVDIVTERVLWRKDFAVEFPPLGHDAYTSLIHALSFDESSRLLVGLWGDIFPGLHELNPWLYLFDSSGNVVWKREFNSNIAEQGAFISTNGLAVVAATETEDGRVYYINRDTNFTYAKLVGYNIWPGHSLWSLPYPIAVSPGGDYFAIADRNNIYIMSSLGVPEFKIPVANATSIALGGGYLAAGAIGGATVLSLWGPVDQLIAEAQSAIGAARGLGANVTQAQMFLDTANSSRRNGEWYQAYFLVTKALSAAQEASKVLVTLSRTTSVNETTHATVAQVVGQPLPFSIVVGIGVIVIILGFVVWRIRLGKRHFRP